MALYTELPVYRDTYQLILKVFEYTKEFAKELTLRTERVNKPCFLAPALQPDWLAQSTYI